ncbi:hypothetical protein Xen7305DRAFT_00046740 [Xenococcus sp. PCC 7305]|uniref:M15 family metallopeptidase n=1 Tax=Xenococcus sp. PCC 7305 TaxID=102125 RepID=UPI0002ACC607|nr:M15 family metallopeptidase [Xenococcus sp. PCC 7305]ELS04938.1 hypothetical protein Xen7305DRAFT_00046740 [Xenococcus sp. PCC 7305]
MSDKKKRKRNWYLLIIGFVLAFLVSIGSFRTYHFDFDWASNHFFKTVKKNDWSRTEFNNKTVGEKSRHKKIDEKVSFAAEVNTETFEGKPEFNSEIIDPIPPDIRGKMINVTWRDNRKCPIQLEELVMLEVNHWDYEREVVKGTLIVHRDVAKPLSEVFKELFDIKFPIQSMLPAYEFDGDDIKSMKANNTSAFNCRLVEDARKWSQHAYGKAVDINPLFNPYIKGDVTLPESGRQYEARTCNEPNNYPGMICVGSPVIKEFEKIGWKWGGYWNSLKDYQHFSQNGL